MVNYKCNNCDAEFDFVSHLQEHTKSITACSKYLKKTYDCDHCDKKFTTNKAKKFHINKTCKNNIIISEIEKIKKELEESKKELEESKNKIEQLEKQNKNITNIQNNTIQNNTTIQNNIIIDFGNEDLQLLQFKEKMEIIRKCYDSIAECIKYTHCNDRLPEQKNIKLSNLRSKFAYKIINGKYEAVHMDELLEDTIMNRADDVRNILDEYKNKIPDKTIEKIEDLLIKVETGDDKQIKKEKSKAKLLLYNNFIQNKK